MKTGLWDMKEEKTIKKKRKLRDPLDIGEKALVIAEWLKKKDAPCNLYKGTTENKPFLTRTDSSP